MYLAYILSVASSCCLSHIASCICTSFSKLTLNLKQKKLFKIIAVKPITIVMWKKNSKKNVKHYAGTERNSEHCAG